MQLAMIGAGRMGSNMVRRLLRAGHECVVYDANPAAAVLASKTKHSCPALSSRLTMFEPMRPAPIIASCICVFLLVNYPSTVQRRTRA